METKLIRHGNDLALVIDKSILDMLQISANTKLELTTDGDTIQVTPIRDKTRQARIEASLEKTHDQYGSDLKWLAE